MAGSGTLTIYLVRHAYASHADATKWPDDSARPLTEDGIRRFREAAGGIRRVAPDVELVLSSRWARAWQTAELLHEVAGWPEPLECPALEAEPPSSALEALRVREERTVALVGHEPHLSTLVAVLCASGENGLRLKLKKGAVAAVRMDGEVEPGAGCLLWSVPPRILRAVDGTS